jgi:hypothetical protein
MYVLEGGASNQVQRIIGQNFFLTSISYVNSSIKLNFNQSAYVDLNSEVSEAMRILNIRHVISK